jgi:hypothetical protein
MAAVEFEDDEYGDPIWGCECGFWNMEEDDECQACGKYWE